ncbi:ribonuclease H-like domain-containing protein, partial [Tanacetum coccineum]
LASTSGFRAFALRNIDLEVMEFKYAHTNTTAKLPILKLENGNSRVSVPQKAQENGTSVTKMSVPVTTEEKTNKKNDVKARSLLLMALPNEHQLTFSNEATKKTQKTLLKQQYENFSASSTKSHDSIFNMLQKIVSRLHDDLYNNFKIVEQNVKKSVGAQNLAFMTAPSTSSTNDVNTANLAYEVSTVSPNINIASHNYFLTDDMAEEQVQTNMTLMVFSDSEGHPQKEDQGYVDSGCSRHMTRNMSYLLDFKEFDGGYVTFGGGAKGGKITGKGTLKTGKLDFEDVYFVKELQFNLFSVSQMCDKKNSVLFTNTGCFVLSPDFKLADESQVLLKVPRKNNMYSVDMKNIVPKECLTCLVAKATLDESMLWHRRLGHIYLGFLFGILKIFITEIENLVDNKVKIIICDNGTEFKNRVMSEFCENKGIKIEFSIARTPQQNGVAERINRTLIEAARTMLADSKLPTIFWAEAVNTGCYVQNRVLVVNCVNMQWIMHK